VIQLSTDQGLLLLIFMLGGERISASVRLQPFTVVFPRPCSLQRLHLHTLPSPDFKTSEHLHDRSFNTVI